MSKHLRFFGRGDSTAAVALSFDLDTLVGDWQDIRLRMTRSLPAEFSRDEWAYLIAFLDEKNLWAPYRKSFGEPRGADNVDALLRPRDQVSVWLPSNVSMLGPLTLILLSLVGIPAAFKASSRAIDLTKVFLDFLKAGAGKGPLHQYLTDGVSLALFDRDDPRNAHMAARASVRIVFGGDAAVGEINSLPRRADSLGFAFSDRQSEAWIDKTRMDDETLTALIKVFAIYGQAGCTSPQRVIVLNGTESDALALQKRLVQLWSKVIPTPPAPHVASGNIAAGQWAAAAGWRAAATPNHGSVILVGDYAMDKISGGQPLAIIAATPEQARHSLPQNIQTIGHAVVDPGSTSWLHLLAHTGVKRFVPVARMHHFGPVWDGNNFWQQLFEEIEIAS